MSNNNQTMQALNERLQQIAAKMALNLPLTTYELALWTLYGHTTEAAQ